MADARPTLVIDDEQLKKLLKFQISRNITCLFKNFLIILEDFQSEGYNIPKDVHDRARKKILDNGNDAIREIEKYLDIFEINVKKTLEK
jgi:hypothetical protein